MAPALNSSETHDTLFIPATVVRFSAPRLPRRHFNGLEVVVAGSTPQEVLDGSSRLALQFCALCQEHAHLLPRVDAGLDWPRIARAGFV